MTWSLVEYNGRVAITLGWEVDMEKPEQHRPLWVHPTEKWDQDYYGRFTQIRLVENNYFSCFNSQTYNSQPLSTTGWEFVEETRPIKAPGRGGKDWHWEWSSWSRKYIKAYN